MTSLLVTGIKIATAGISVGLAAAWLLAPPLMSNLLYGVTPRDGGVFATVTLVLLVSSIVATMLPALRAARIDPGVRCETSSATRKNVATDTKNTSTLFVGFSFVASCSSC